MPPKLDFAAVEKYINNTGCVLISETYANNKALMEIQCDKCLKTYMQNFDRFRRGFRHNACKYDNCNNDNLKKSLKRYWEEEDGGRKVLEKDCSYCNKKFKGKRNSQKTCDMQCSEELKKMRASTEEYKNYCRIGGQISASVGHNRSQNEIYFAGLCGKQFDVITNVPMFDGWDADVIIPSLKIAIHWNGVWHYKQVRADHDLALTQHRDKFKHKMIKKHGYTNYIIVDMGAYNQRFVEEQFRKFMDYVYFI